MANINLSVKRTPWGEFKVAVVKNGRYNEDASYYTDDRKDAEGTMQMMARDYRSSGNEVHTKE